MKSFKDFIKENQQNNNVQQPLEAAKQQFFAAFKQQFGINPNDSLTWLNNFFSKELPQVYKTMYQQSQKNGNNNQQNPQGNMNNNQQQNPQGSMNNNQQQN